MGVAAVISEELAAATRRAAELAEAELAAEGFRRPAPTPCSCSARPGRGESLLALDQDNAIVFAEGEPGGAEDRYFARLGARLADILDAVGIPYCRGGVMAREDGVARQPRRRWRKRVADWLPRSSPEDLLSVDIFFDARAVAWRHAARRRADVGGAWQGEPGAAFHQAARRRFARAAAAIGLFGRLKSENGRHRPEAGGIAPDRLRRQASWRCATG